MGIVEGNMVKHELRVASYELKAEKHELKFKSRFQIHELRV